MNNVFCELQQVFDTWTRENGVFRNAPRERRAVLAENLVIPIVAKNFRQQQISAPYTTELTTRVLVQAEGYTFCARNENRNWTPYDLRRLAKQNKLRIEAEDSAVEVFNSLGTVAPRVHLGFSLMNEGKTVKTFKGQQQEWYVFGLLLRLVNKEYKQYIEETFC